MSSASGQLILLFVLIALSLRDILKSSQIYILCLPAEAFLFIKSAGGLSTSVLLSSSVAPACTKPFRYRQVPLLYCCNSIQLFPPHPLILLLSEKDGAPLLIQTLCSTTSSSVLYSAYINHSFFFQSFSFANLYISIPIAIGTYYLLNHNITAAVIIIFSNASGISVFHPKFIN